MMVRDQGASRVLSHSLKTEQRSSARAGEEMRIRIVLSKYKYYRYGAAVLLGVAVAGLALLGRGWGSSNCRRLAPGRGGTGSHRSLLRTTRSILF